MSPLRVAASAPQFDAIVVGSGAGGGVAAALLAEAGLRVALLEEGAHVPSSQFTQREGDMYAKLFRDRGLQASEDGSVLVLQGSCVGGSTVINMGDVTPIPPELIDYWRREFRADGLDAVELAAAAARVRTAIGAGPIADHELNRNNTLLREGARKLNWRHGVFEDNRVGCVGSGYCQIGCSYDAKRSVLVTYVPRALKAGAVLFDRTWCERVDLNRDAVVGVTALRTLADGSRERLALAAPAVFVAAGAIHTPLLLRRSRVGGRLVGRNLSLQPQAPVVARFSERLRSFRGIPQATFVDEFERISDHDGFGGFRIEGIFGPPATGSQLLPGVGAQIRDLITRYDQLAAALVLVPDRPDGVVSSFGQDMQARILYEPSAAVFATLKRGMLAAAELYLAAGAAEVIFPVSGAAKVRNAAELDRARRELELRPAGVPLISAHPQGTARMSDDRRRGVVDSSGRVHNTKGLYVVDASVFPTTASSHTMLPIMSMADANVRRFLAASGA